MLLLLLASEPSSFLVVFQKSLLPGCISFCLFFPLFFDFLSMYRFFSFVFSFFRLSLVISTLFRFWRFCTIIYLYFLVFSSFFQIYIFLWAFFVHVRACCRWASSPQTQHSKAQSAPHKAAKHVRVDQNATTRASRQRWRKLACRAFAARCVL